VFLSSLELTEFRSYTSLHLPLDRRGLTLVGRNASGKSTVLEAISMLSTMRSPRAGSDREVISWESGDDLGVDPYARVVGRAETVDGPLTVELGLQVGPAGEGALRKQIKVNQRPTRAVDAVGYLRSVLFTPDDVDLVSGPPSGRRRFLDILLSQHDRSYVRSLASYMRVLEQRNSLLRQLAKSRVSSGGVAGQLQFWDEQLIEHGAAVVARRRAAIARLGDAVTLYGARFDAGGPLSITYEANLGASFLSATAEVVDLARLDAVALRDFAQEVARRRDDELRRGVSLVGPHRDDIAITLHGRSLATYGSRGQQRTAVVALKLAQADLLGLAEGDPPVVLLDDVTSELDPVHRDTLLGIVDGSGAQILLTTADAGQVGSSVAGDRPVVKVVGGKIEGPVGDG
jgi:DNA replication and repair protein RecF